MEYTQSVKFNCPWGKFDCPQGHMAKDVTISWSFLVFLFSFLWLFAFQALSTLVVTPVVIYANVESPSSYSTRTRGKRYPLVCYILISLGTSLVKFLIVLMIYLWNYKIYLWNYKFEMQFRQCNTGKEIQKIFMHSS